MAKINTSRKKFLVAICAMAIMAVAAVASLVVVLAAGSQDVTTTFDIGFSAIDVAGSLKMSYKIEGGEFSTPREVTFDGTEDTTEVTSLSPSEELLLTYEENNVIFKYEIVGHAADGYHLSMEYVDRNAADANQKIEYMFSATDTENYAGMTLASSVGTLFANEHRGDNEKVFLYVRVSIKDLQANMAQDGSYHLWLTKAEWLDPNLDTSTGIAYGYVENNGSPYAVAVNYTGTATELTINTTSVYGEELPVKTIADYAFAAPSTSALATNVLLTKLTIGNNVETIEGYAFAYNTSLTEAVIGNWVSSLAPTAFYGCTGLNKVTNKSALDLTEYEWGGVVQIETPLAMRVEEEKFNNRHYYYVEMGEYPQTYAGAATAVTGLTETQDKFVLDMTNKLEDGTFNFMDDVEYNIWKDSIGNEYIKHTTTPFNVAEIHSYLDGTAATIGEIAFFKIEPIKWDVVGYYTDDSKTNFVRVTDSDYDKSITSNLVVITRDGLQAMVWHEVSADVDYNNSYLYKWLRTFETSAINDYLDVQVVKCDNYYTDTNGMNTNYNGIVSGTATMMHSPVEEYAWLMNYQQITTYFLSSQERLCSATDFAIANYTYLNPNYAGITRKGTCTFWARDSYFSGGNNVTFVSNCGGGVEPYGNYKLDTGMRPCMLINL